MFRIPDQSHMKAKGYLRVLLDSVLRPMGYEIRRSSLQAQARRAEIVKRHGIGTVLDVGANVGQYASALRRSGFAGNIVSFEPLPHAYEALEARFRDDPRWTGRRLALGAETAVCKFNVTSDSVCSSLLSASPGFVGYAPAARTSASIPVDVRTLDGIWEELNLGNGKVMLKLDVQGAEQQVLKGASGSLGRISLIESELSLVELYDGQPLLLDMLSMLDSAGFQLILLEPNFSDLRTGETWQVDGIFVSRDASSRGLEEI